MKGIVIVTHGNLGASLIETAEIINGAKADAITSVSISPDDNVDLLQEKVARGIKVVNRNRGILILTDMFGGTPSNLSYAFLEEGQIEVVSGVNLPILLHALGVREKKSLTELAKSLELVGKRSISMASGLLKGEG